MALCSPSRVVLSRPPSHINSPLARVACYVGHITSNLLENACTALYCYPVKNCYAWTDSTVALYWIRSIRWNYRKFVGNRAFNIKSKELITWKYVPTRKNPADPGRRGCLTENLTKSCFNRVFWLTNQ